VIPRYPSVTCESTAFACIYRTWGCKTLLYIKLYYYLVIILEQHVERVVDTTFGSAENIKEQAADALVEAARKIRELSISAKGEDVKAILNDTEAKIEKLKSDMGQKVEPVEDFITEHPLMSVAIAAGAGLLMGSLLTRRD